jgi:hypothetical protein
MTLNGENLEKRKSFFFVNWTSEVLSLIILSQNYFWTLF